MSSLEHYFLGFHRGGSVGSFDDQFSIEFLSISDIYGLLEGSGDEDVTMDKTSNYACW